ncbi:cytochrome P450 [Nonomuraea longicatena]|uniref:Cytochrome P450 n=1 Tax=Nonomuraea longicatena TaxID=83682 RepID=A0ABN1NW57_9ACTN
MIPEIDLADPEVVRDPATVYGRAREQGPVARLVAPGFGVMWAMTRHSAARAMLSDPRFAMGPNTFLDLPIPDPCRKYLRSLGTLEGAEHTRLRRLVSPAFTARRMHGLRTRIEAIVERILDELPGHAVDGVVDLQEHFARPIPADVICDLVGIPEADRADWRRYGAAIQAGHGQEFIEAIPRVMAGAEAAVAHHRAEPGENLISDLIRAQEADGDRLDDTELVTFVWQLALAGQAPVTTQLANAVEVLLRHPDQLALLRAEPERMAWAVEELIRWAGPQLLTFPRFATEDVEFEGVRIRAGEAVTAAIAAVNRDPRVYTDPERLDLTRSPGEAAHLGFAHGPHFCLGASLARVEIEVALTALLRRHPALATAGDGATRVPDPGTWRLATLPVTL